MLIIRSEQMQTLREALERYQTDQIVSEIISLLHREVPEVMGHYTSEQHRQYVREVLDASKRFGIVDFEQVVNWSFIRFLTNMRFYEAEQLKDIFDNPLLHPYAKGRHIVLAFFAIQRMMRQDSQLWPQ